MTTSPEVGAPLEGYVSRSTTKAGVLRDIRSRMLENYRDTGRVRPSVGVTQPVAPVTRSFQDIMTEVLGWKNQLKKTEGGFAMDRIDQGKPRAVGQPEQPAFRALSAGYGNRRFEFLSESEGVRDKAYQDHNGNTTIGIGFNMERPDARKVLETATGRTDFEALKAGKARLKPREVRNLFDWTIAEAEKIVADRFEDTDLLEHQRLSLVSLAFNNPSLIGPNLTRLVKAGDTRGARDEILYRSNKNKHKGIANRRYREAAMWMGDATATAELPAYPEYITPFT